MKNILSVMHNSVSFQIKNKQKTHQSKIDDFNLILFSNLTKGGVDQRKIFTFARKYLPLLGYNKRIHFMNHMVPGLTGDKMSSSEENSKIDVLDSAESVVNKINNALCEIENLENNGVLAFTKTVILPLFNSFKICSNDECKLYYEYNELERDFKEGKLTGQQLKTGVSHTLNRLMEPMRKRFENPELKKLAETAYPNAN